MDTREMSPPGAAVMLAASTMAPKLRPSIQNPYGVPCCNWTSFWMFSVNSCPVRAVIVVGTPATVINGSDCDPLISAVAPGLEVPAAITRDTEGTAPAGIATATRAVRETETEAST